VLEKYKATIIKIWDKVLNVYRRFVYFNAYFVWSDFHR